MLDVAYGFQLKRDHKDHEAALITNGKGAKHVQLLFEKTQVMIDFAQSKAVQFLTSTLSSEKTSILTILIITVFLFLS